MGKDTLLGGSLWEAYSKKVQERMDNPTHLGVITQEDADKKGAKLIVADYGAEACGDAVRLYWLVDSNDTIIDAKFKSFGCGTAIASSDMMVELCLNKKVQDAVKITNIDVEKALRDEPNTPAVPGQKMHCSVMAYDVIKKAAGIYLGKSAEDFEDEIIVCECARVSLSTIKDVIRLNDLKSVEEITLTEETEQIERTAKPNGTAYHFEKLLITADTPKTDAVGRQVVRLYVNGNTFDLYNTAYESSVTYAKRSAFLCSAENGFLKVEGINGVVNYGDEKVPMGTSTMSGTFTPTDTITKFRLKGEPSFAAGTKIKIYGVKAIATAVATALNTAV